MTVDREALRSWYVEAMGRRIEELREAREGIVVGEERAYDAARAVGQALRGSGATFGFADLSPAAGLVETAPDGALLRRVEGLIEHLHRVRAGEAGPPGLRLEWLVRAAGVRPRGAEECFESVEDAWERLASLQRLDPAELARRAAAELAVETADLSRASPTALRLVPEALLRAHRLMPVAEGPQTLDVAAADPTSLDAELELIRVTGRTPVLFVAPPGAIEAALERTLGARPRAPRRPGPRAVVPGAHRVLVVDDDAGSRLLASAVLTKRGYEVVQAEDGVEALHRLRQSGPFSLVVADLNMPHMDGLSLLWELRSGEQWAHLPVLVLTGETDEALEAQLIDEGADDYICKPLDPRLFLARVRATIRRAEEGVGVPVPGPTDARDGEPHGPEAR